MPILRSLGGSCRLRRTDADLQRRGLRLHRDGVHFDLYEHGHRFAQLRRVQPRLFSRPCEQRPLQRRGLRALLRGRLSELQQSSFACGG